MSEFVFKLPDLGEGTVQSEIAEWMVAVGDVVKEEQPICSMLTDKAAVELSAPVSGRVVSLAGEAGDTIAVGTPLIVFETDARPAQAAPAARLAGATSAKEPPAKVLPTKATPAKSASVEPAATEAAKTAPAASRAPAHAATQSADSAGGARVRTSPSIRRRAREAGVDLAGVTGTGPRGRILKTDFEQRLASGEAQARPGRRKAVGQTEIKVIGLRRRIAERMDQANRGIPHFAYVEEVDVTLLESLRRYLNERRDRDGSSLTPLPFIALALIRALREHPECNAHYDAERNVLTRFEAVHLGIATQTHDGLKVPVVKHAEALGLDELAAEIRRVSSAARDNSASREMLSGSTITLTSLGKLGGIVSTPIINLPEVAIIGVNKVTARPVFADGAVVVRQMMNLSSSFDHRFVDGYDAAAMIQHVKEYLEQPATLFID